MATVIIGRVIVKLGGIVGEQVANQATLLLNFRKDFEWLQRKLQYATGFMQDAYNLKNESVKKWLADVQDIAYDAEDIVEECVVQPLHRNLIPGDSLFFRYKMGRRMRKLKHRMESIMKDAADLKLVQQLYHFDQPSTSHDRAEEWKKSSLVERDARPIAIDAKVEKFLRLLEDDALQVIAIVGIGKTFLLQNVYNHHEVHQNFKKAIWLSISQIYSVARLQADIASHLGLNNIEAGHLTEQRAAELIHERLKDQRSLIVLDDVWRVEGVNNLIQRLGISGGTNNPSKVVLTTRSKEVCKIMGASHIYQMELLSEQDSWNLFCLHAFPDYQHNSLCQELEEVARQVERECGRLPLAIKTVAASMVKEELSSWKSKLRQLKEVSDSQDPIMPILRLSYDALPAVLKPCFLYFSFFAEDEEIDAEYLIYLWIGEGLIREGRDQWITGWSYLKQLNNLCLVEDVSKVPLGWIHYSDLNFFFKIHDLLLDLIISISTENKCAFTIEQTWAIECRRILLAKKGLKDDDISGFECRPSLRTLSLSQNKVSKLPTKSLSGVRALRVIDIKDTSISELPRCIGNFKLLRVLSLNYDGMGMVITIPDCVRNLKSLCFLDARRYFLPSWIGDLTCLQHLHVYAYHGPAIRGISKLVSLRTLRSGLDEISLVVKEVAKLIHLQELHLHIANEEEQRSLEEGVLIQLVNLHHLSISSNVPTFPEKMKAMKGLEYLELNGFTVPRWICEYENLRVLKLRSCDLSQCPSFETMPNLLKLQFNEWPLPSKECPCKELPDSFAFHSYALSKFLAA